MKFIRIPIVWYEVFKYVDSGSEQLKKFTGVISFLSTNTFTLKKDNDNDDESYIFVNGESHKVIMTLDELENFISNQIK